MKEFLVFCYLKPLRPYPFNHQPNKVYWFFWSQLKCTTVTSKCDGWVSFNRKLWHTLYGPIPKLTCLWNLLIQSCVTHWQHLNLLFWRQIRWYLRSNLYTKKHRPLQTYLGKVVGRHWFDLILKKFNINHNDALASLKEKQYILVILTFSSSFVRTFIAFAYFFLLLESHKRITMWQVTPEAYLHE